MDGFGDPTGYGLIYQQYVRFASARSIKDAAGASAPFKDPRLDVFVDVNQFVYSFQTSGWVQPGIDVEIPLVNANASFGSPGPRLAAGGFGLGDLTFGPFVQLTPIRFGSGNVLAQRFELDLIAPTGRYEADKQINPGSHAWSVNPYWAATWLFARRFEFSNRLQYLFNAENGDPGTPGAQTTQAGQAIIDNFSFGFEAIPHALRFGISGYVFKQITESKTNGVPESGSLEQALGLGPGAMWTPGHEDAFWVNAYREAAVENRPQNAIVQLRWAHAFADF
jgi:hypothetical protein